MNFFAAVCITALVALAAAFFLPWYAVALAGFAVGYFLPQTGWRAFAASFLGVFLLWLVYTGWIDYQNQHVLAPKVAELLKLPNTGLLFFLTALIGGLCAGMGALTGQQLKQITARN
ncbi:MAG: hypothetical protein U0T84_02735 [Chitinophagales bacterium]